MYETLGIEIGRKNNLFPYMGDTTSKYKNMYNVIKAKPYTYFLYFYLTFIDILSFSPSTTIVQPL